MVDKPYIYIPFGSVTWAQGASGLQTLRQQCVRAGHSDVMLQRGGLSLYLAPLQAVHQEVPNELHRLVQREPERKRTTCLSTSTVHLLPTTHTCICFNSYQPLKRTTTALLPPATAPQTQTTSSPPLSTPPLSATSQAMPKRTPPRTWPSHRERSIAAPCSLSTPQGGPRAHLSAPSVRSPLIWARQGKRSIAAPCSLDSPRRSGGALERAVSEVALGLGEAEQEVYCSLLFPKNP